MPLHLVMMIFWIPLVLPKHKAVGLTFTAMLLVPLVTVALTAAQRRRYRGLLGVSLPRLPAPPGRRGLVRALARQYVEEHYAADLLTAHTSGIGYLLKQRVADVAEFTAVLHRVVAGGTALDPQVVAQLLLRRDSDPTGRLTPREREVLALMAEGRSNTAIAETLVVTDSAVANHIDSIFAKLCLLPADSDHRRVLAVLKFLNASRPA